MQADNQTPLRKILLLAANPKGTLPLRLDEEQRRIKDSLKQSHGRDKFDVHAETAVTIAHIRRALLEHQPEIVHFCGHGAGTDGIACEDDLGQVKLIPTSALTNLFKLVESHVKCVVLNACFAEIQANEIVRYIEYVVGMKYSIGDKASLQFAEGFYDALFAGKEFTDCYQWGINAIQLESIAEDSTPVIKIKEQLFPIKKTTKALQKKKATLLIDGSEKKPITQKAKKPAGASGKSDLIISTSHPQVPFEEKYLLHNSQPLEHNHPKEFRGILLAVSLSVAIISVLLTLILVQRGSGETDSHRNQVVADSTMTDTVLPVQPTAEPNRMVGYYWQEKNATVDEQDGDNPHFKYRAVGSSFFIFFNPKIRKLQAVEITVWEIYYCPDLKYKNITTKIGGYSAEWLYTEVDNSTSTADIIKMRGAHKRRLGVEIEGTGGEQLPSDKVRTEYTKEVHRIQDGYISAYSEVSLDEGGKIIRKNWYNGDEKHTGKKPEELTFIRQ